MRVLAAELQNLQQVRDRSVSESRFARLVSIDLVWLCCRLGLVLNVICAVLPKNVEDSLMHASVRQLVIQPTNRIKIIASPCQINKALRNFTQNGGQLLNLWFVLL